MEYLWAGALLSIWLVVCALILLRKGSLRAARITPELPAVEAEIVCEPVASDTSTSRARKWLDERTTKLHQEFAVLGALRDKLVPIGWWHTEDESRYRRVEKNVDDYLRSAEAQLEPSFYSYCQMYKEGPTILVPMHSGCWTLAWGGAQMVDAHVELLRLHAQVRLRLAQTGYECRDREERHLAELERCITRAGFNTGNPLVPQYLLANIARQVSGLGLVNFQDSPFGTTLDEALNLVRLSDKLPEGGDYFRAKYRRLSAFSSAQLSPWRQLTDDEKSAVRAKMQAAVESRKRAD